MPVPHNAMLLAKPSGMSPLQTLTRCCVTLTLAHKQRRQVKLFGSAARMAEPSRGLFYLPIIYLWTGKNIFYIKHIIRYAWVYILNRKRKKAMHFFLVNVCLEVVLSGRFSQQSTVLIHFSTCSYLSEHHSLSVCR